MSIVQFGQSARNNLVNIKSFFLFIKENVEVGQQLGLQFLGASDQTSEKQSEQEELRNQEKWFPWKPLETQTLSSVLRVSRSGVFNSRH